MEFAEGGDLRKDMKAKGRYSEERCIEAIEAIAGALTTRPCVRILRLCPPASVNGV